MNEETNPTEPESNNTAGMFNIDPQFIINRVKEICTNPFETWKKIKEETIDVKDFFMNFLGPLFVFSGLCHFIGFSVVGIAGFRIPMMNGLVSMVMSVVFGLVGVYVGALILQQIAPKFDGEAGIEDCLKLVGYSLAPIEVAQIFTIIPVLGLLTFIVGLYCIYIFFSGVSLLTSVPEAKKVPYVVVSAVAIIVVNAIIGIAVSMFNPAPPPPVINPKIDFSTLELPLGK